MNDDTLATLLWIKGTDRISDRTIMKLSEKIELSSLWDMSERSMADLGLLRSDQVSHLLSRKDKSRFEDDALKIMDGKVHVCSIWDEVYPHLLREIYDPPSLLFMKGDVSLLQLDGMAIVGTRRPSELGKRLAESFGAEVSNLGIPIVSGMAMGIDRHAHIGGLSGRGRSIGILATGIEAKYPASNIDLYGKMEAEGLLVTEFLPGTIPMKYNFPMRNRVISGLSGNVLVVEAGIRSGALITANYAADQGRNVMAVPGAVSSPASKGCNEAIKSGAKVVTCMDDIIEELSPRLRIITPSVYGNESRDESHSPFERSLIDFIARNQPVSIFAMESAFYAKMSTMRETLMKLIMSGEVFQGDDSRFFIK
jgi:DNA processing protein